MIFCIIYLGTLLTIHYFYGLGDNNTIWIPGETGATGYRGETGATGTAGKPGTPGAKGETGEPGRHSSSDGYGETGATGFQGETGATGAIGPPGIPGQRGLPGIPGRSHGLAGKIVFVAILSLFLVSDRTPPDCTELSSSNMLIYIVVH